MNYIRPKWSTSALVTIDTQNDFCLPNAPAKIEGTDQILSSMQTLLAFYRVQKSPIIHVIRLYKENGSNVDICRREAIENGSRIVTPYTEGAELVNEIRPPEYPGLDADTLLEGDFQQIGDREWVMYKSRWGAFYKTNLESFLHAHAIDTLVFIGCNFPNCPRTSMYEASERDFRIAMVTDAMSQVYEKGVQEMQNIGVFVTTTDKLLYKISANA